MRWPKEEPTGADPPDGAIVNCYLKSAVMQQVHTLTDAIYFGAVDAPAAAAETSALREQAAKIQARGQAAAALNATDAVMACSASLESVDLPALNATLKAAGLPPIGGGSVRQAIGRKTRTTHPGGRPAGAGLPVA